MKNTNYESSKKDELSDITIRLEEIVLFQDRTKDDNKSFLRFKRDKVLLLQDHTDNPTDSRIVFYLAQTCECLSENEEAYYYYKIRNNLPGFWEENFHSYLRCGNISQKINNKWEETMKWYIKAFEYSSRAEPLIKISEHYKDKNWMLCYAFASLACKLDYPKNCNLFVDEITYKYKRWHLLGISGWYTNNYTEGKFGCMKAIESGINNEIGINTEIDKSNLKFYEDKESELNMVSKSNK